MLFKIHCKGKSFRFSGYRDPLLQTKKRLLLYIIGLKKRGIFLQDMETCTKIVFWSELIAIKV